MSKAGRNFPRDESSSSSSASRRAHRGTRSGDEGSRNSASRGRSRQKERQAPRTREERSSPWRDKSKASRASPVARPRELEADNDKEPLSQKANSPTPVGDVVGGEVAGQQASQPDMAGLCTDPAHPAKTDDRAYLKQRLEEAKIIGRSLRKDRRSARAESCRSVSTEPTDGGRPSTEILRRRRDAAELLSGSGRDDRGGEPSLLSGTFSALPGDFSIASGLARNDREAGRSRTPGERRDLTPGTAASRRMESCGSTLEMTKAERAELIRATIQDLERDQGHAMSREEEKAVIARVDETIVLIADRGGGREPSKSPWRSTGQDRRDRESASPVRRPREKAGQPGELEDRSRPALGGEGEWDSERPRTFRSTGARRSPGCLRCDGPVPITASNSSPRPKAAAIMPRDTLPGARRVPGEVGHRTTGKEAQVAETRRAGTTRAKAKVARAGSAAAPRGAARAATEPSDFGGIATRARRKSRKQPRAPA